MMGTVSELVRIYDNPNHPQYGPVRRCWLMLEQMFADKGGIAKFEVQLHLYQDTQTDRGRIYWDEHLAQLLRSGLSSADATRTVVMQMITAQLWVQ